MGTGNWDNFENVEKWSEIYLGKFENAGCLVDGLILWAKNDYENSILKFNKIRRQEYYGSLASEFIFDICLKISYDHVLAICGRQKSTENSLAAHKLCQQI